MKVGDLVEIYRHIPKYESGIVPVGYLGKGVIIQIDSPPSFYPDCEDLLEFSYLSSDGQIYEEVISTQGQTGTMITVKVIQEKENEE